MKYVDVVDSINVIVGALLLTLNIFHTFCASVSIFDLEQVNVCREIGLIWARSLSTNTSPNCRRIA